MQLPGATTESYATRYAHWVIRWRIPVLALALMAAAVATWGLRDLRFSADYRVYFSADNPQLLDFEALENTYTKTDNILFVLQPGDQQVFTNEMLGIIKALTEDAWQIPYAMRVDSITNFQHTQAAGDDLVVADLVEDPAALDSAGLAGVRTIALQEPALVNRLISKDAATAGIMVTLQLPGDDYTEFIPAAVNRAAAMATTLRSTYPDMTVALTGIAVFSHAETTVSQQDLLRLLPVMYSIFVIAMLALLRSFYGTLVALLVVTLSALSAVGISAWLGMQMNPSTALAPIVILTLAIADSVHLLMTTFQEMRTGSSRQIALVKSLRVNTEPVFLTSLTTLIGFLSLNFSDAPPFRDLGNISAMGVFAAWGFSMTVLPALVSMLPLSVGQSSSPSRLPMEWFGDFIIAHRTSLLWVMTLLALLLAAFIPRLELDDRFIQWFDEDTDFRQDTDFASANLIGPYTLEFSIGSGEAGGIQDPAYLERLEAFAHWLRAQPEVSHVYSLTDIMKRLNKSLHGDEQDWYRLPESRELAAQYLLLYEMSLPYGLDLNSQLNLDKSATRVTVSLQTVPMKGIRAITDRSENWLAENMPGEMQTQATGLTIVFVYLAERNIRSMLGGTALAFLLISVTLMLALRSIRMGLVSLIPNFLPVAMTFGLWGLLVGHIGIIASIITATTLGLIVDDTVHILSKYHRARSLQGLSAHDAIRFSFSHVGTALWVTTVVLVTGFMVLTQSRFALNADMGLLTSITLVFALFMDFLLLPPLLMLLDRDASCNCKTCRKGNPPLSMQQ